MDEIRKNNAQRNLERDEMISEEEVKTIHRLYQLGWGKKRIARELGISPNTVKKYLTGNWEKTTYSPRSKKLDEHQEWLEEQFRKHRGNAAVVYQELKSKQDAEISLRTVQRAVSSIRGEMENQAKETIRFETDPGEQLQIDFGECKIEIGGVEEKVFLFVATLGWSRAIYVQAFHNERQESWFIGLDNTFRHFNGVPKEVLTDNPKALVTSHNRESGVVKFNEKFKAFARYWGFEPKACKPYRARTKGKDERNVGYVKHNGIAGHEFSNWEHLQNHLDEWRDNIADSRIHGTTGEQPRIRLEKEREVLQALDGKPPFFQPQEYKRKVHTDAHVEYGSNHYSVPRKFIGKKVRVRVNQRTICILMGNTEIAKHEISEGKRARVTNNEHLCGIVGSYVAGKKRQEPTQRWKQGELQRPLSEYQEALGGGF